MDKRGQQAEQVAHWYFRLNGFLTIPGFVVHPDQRQRCPRTEADIMGVRLPFSVEEIAGRPMLDDPILTGLANREQVLFVLVEIKADLCKINGPWSDKNAGNMERVIRRFGFSGEGAIEGIAAQMYSQLRWEEKDNVLQYVTVGRRWNQGLQRKYPGLLQITWNQVSDFLFERFSRFPEKLPDGRAFHPQWPNFGKEYCRCWRHLRSADDSRNAVLAYIESGSCSWILDSSG